MNDGFSGLDAASRLGLEHDRVGHVGIDLAWQAWIWQQLQEAVSRRSGRVSPEWQRLYLYTFMDSIMAMRAGWASTYGGCDAGSRTSRWLISLPTVASTL